MERRRALLPRLLALLGLVAGVAVAACAGANGDPAPAPQEAGVATPAASCVDAGVSG
jgi:hypothetical protein